ERGGGRGDGGRGPARAAGAGCRLAPRARAWALGVGELQQLAILKLLFRGREILILDEPTAVLSPPQAAELFKSMRTLAAAGKSIIFITHRLREVGAVASEVTILRQGKVVADRAVAGLDAQQMS